jgi:hypothetical protein
LGLQLAALRLFYWPVIVLVYATARDWTPFAMALPFGSLSSPTAGSTRAEPTLFFRSPWPSFSRWWHWRRAAACTSRPPLAAGCCAVALVLLWFEIKA